ncbi:MAG: hypothetical protein Kow00114_30490 [Kiloniellaceae bacterium]
MVSIDDRLGEAAPSMPKGFPAALPRALPRSLPLLLAGGLALGVLAAAVAGGWLAGPADAALSGADEVVPASGEPAMVPAGACQRIQEIVETACGYKQYDHDAAGIRQCVAYELKYTMWSAYGCR